MTEVKKTAGGTANAALSERTTDDGVSRQSFDALREGGWGAPKLRRDAVYREDG